MNRILFMFLFGIVLLACTSQENNLPAGKWTLTDMPNEDLSVLKNPITLDFSTTRAKGFAGCNEYWGSCSINNSSIEFSSIGSTYKLCKETIDLESQFLKSLRDVNGFNVKDGKLQLLQDNLVLLEFEK